MATPTPVPVTTTYPAAVVKSTRKDASNALLDTTEIDYPPDSASTDVAPQVAAAAQAFIDGGVKIFQQIGAPAPQYITAPGQYARHGEGFVVSLGPNGEVYVDAKQVAGISAVRVVVVGLSLLAVDTAGKTWDWQAASTPPWVAATATDVTLLNPPPPPPPPPVTTWPRIPTNTQSIVTPAGTWTLSSDGQPMLGTVSQLPAGGVSQLLAKSDLSQVYAKVAADGHWAQWLGQPNDWQYLGMADPETGV